MEHIRDLSTMNYTGRIPYGHLRGTLPSGYRILNRFQRDTFKRAQVKTGTFFKHEGWDDGYRSSRGVRPKVSVQLHHLEMELNPSESRQYVRIMTKAGWKHLIKR